MHLDSGGNNILLGPGIHLIRDLMMFIKIINLNSFFIEIGPENWVTVPMGYEGISIDRGQIKILEGGKLHHLPHVAEKFAKMVLNLRNPYGLPSPLTQTQPSRVALPSHADATLTGCLTLSRRRNPYGLPYPLTQTQPLRVAFLMPAQRLS